MLIPLLSNRRPLAAMANAASFASPSSLAVTVPNNVAEGSAIYVALAYTGTATTDPFTAGLPAGFSLRLPATEFATLATAHAWGAIAVKTAGASEGHSWAFGLAGGAVRGAYTVGIYGGLDPALFDVAAASAASGSSTAPAAPSITTETSPALGLLAVFHATGSNTASLSGLPPGWAIEAAAAEAPAAQCALVDALLSPAGATGAIGGTFNVTQNWLAVADALRFV